MAGAPPGAGMSDVCIQQGASVRSTTPSRVFDSPTVWSRTELRIAKAATGSLLCTTVRWITGVTAAF